MSKTVLSEVDGFTPLIDDLVKQQGIITASVFGRVWRYCQGTDGVCSASMERIGNDLGLDRVTVIRHCQKLVEAGYLKDTTPTRRNRPHVYADTGKAGLSIRVGVAESYTIGVAESNTGVAESNTGVAESNTGGVAESHLKIQVKRQSKREPQTHSPAVMAFRSGAKAWPAKAQWPAIDTAVACDPESLARWQSTVEAYVLRGWNPRNVAGMLEFYKRGEIPGRNGNGKPADKSTNAGRLPDGA